MKKMLILGIAVAIACAAHAYPTLTGPTGLATLPTAAVAPAGQFQLAADWFDTEDTVGDTTIPVRLLYGFGGNFEFGATYISSELSGFGLNAKWLTPLTLAGFDWALGAQYVNLTDDFVVGEGDFGPEVLDIDATGTQVYFAGTRVLMDAEDGIGLTGTIGLNWTKIEADLTLSDDLGEFDSESESEDAIRFYAGLEAAFANNLTVAAEIQSDGLDFLGEEDMLWSVVARYPFTESIAAQVGYTNAITFIGADDSNLFAGLTYAWGAAE